MPHLGIFASNIVSQGHLAWAQTKPAETAICTIPIADEDFDIHGDWNRIHPSLASQPSTERRRVRRAVAGSGAPCPSIKGRLRALCRDWL